jgi:hypothetical protein
MKIFENLENAFDDEKNVLDIELKKNSKNEQVKKVKFALNQIANLRSISTFTLNGTSIRFPLKVDEILDETSFELAKEFFPKFKSSGILTARLARNRWVFLAGYYYGAFPDILVKSSNYDQCIELYNNGIIQKTKELGDNLITNILSVFEKLGAKYIKISEQHSIEGDISAGIPTNAGKVDIGANSSYSHALLREKNFGIGSYNKEAAINMKSLFSTNPKIISVINSRIESNLLSENFIEEINFGAGFSLKVSEIGGSGNFKKSRKWEIYVEFFDKNLY